MENAKEGGNIEMKHCSENMTLMVNNYNNVTGYECQICKKRKMVIPVSRVQWCTYLDNIVIHTDGSVSGNGKPDAIGGWAAILEYYKLNTSGSLRFMELEKEIYGRLTFETDDVPVTNNRAEMYGILMALERINMVCNVFVYSDSELCIKSINGIYSRKTNLDIWNRIDAIVKELKRIGCNIEFIWEKGHSGIVLNERCDRLASKVKRGEI